MNKFHQTILQNWYQKPSFWVYLLLPLTFLFMLISFVRRWLYRLGWKKSYKLPVPVIVVGNISVGGTGKTPLVIYLAELLKHQGYKPGIISRGYGGDNAHVRSVTENSNPNIVGDEALLIHRRTHCPVVVSQNRPLAAKTLLAENHCDVIISDDGLQHYALQRDIEIAVIDGKRRFGNRFCLPCGPLREPIERLESVDFVICNGDGAPGEITMRLHAEKVQSLVHAERHESLASFCGKSVHAVAAIGHPERFFENLQAHGIEIIKRPFPDHYRFRSQDLSFTDNLPVLITEKDAVKCLSFANEKLWYVPVSATIGQDFDQSLIDKLNQLQKSK